MKFRYLGTGAAEGIPSPFCDCDVCRKARELQGRNIKRRSCVIINNDMLVDLSPDIFWAAISEKAELHNIRSIVFTHSHADHLDIFSLMLRCRDGATVIPSLSDDENHIDVYGNMSVKARISSGFVSEPHANRNRIVFHQVFAKERFEVGSLELLPLEANHAKGEDCFIYVIREGDKAVLYGNDTGALPESSISALCDYDIPFSLVSLDCSRGTLKGDAHMGIEEVCALVARLMEAGRIDSRTRIYLNHFSHVCGLLPDEFEKIIEPIGLHLSYDGLVLDL